MYKLSYNIGECKEYDFEILRNAVFSDKYHVKFYLVRHDLLYVCALRVVRSSQYFVLVNVFYRCIVGYSRTYAQHFALFVSVKVCVFFYFRSWSYKAHFTSYYIYELRKLVYLIFAYEISGACYAAVMSANGYKPMFVCIGVHRAEFQQLERFAVSSGTFLTIESPSTAF